MTLAIYLQRMDPFAFELMPGVGLRWYGLSYLAGFLAAFLLIRTMSRRGISPLPEAKVGDFVMTVALGTVIGGRLGYCLFYKPELLAQWSSRPPFWGLLAINEGGMASHGGLVGILLACAWYARRHALPAAHLVDLAAATGPLGAFFGRLANFVNGELYGRACEASFAWAVKFPQEIRFWADPKDPGHAHLQSAEFAQIRAMVEADPVSSGSGCACVTAPEGLDRVIQMVQNQDAVAAALEPLLTPRHPSQIYQALMEGLILFVFLQVLWLKPRRPGVIAAWFLVGYVVMRVIGEQFRLPDAHLGYQALGLTRGQWLSLGMLAAGLAAIPFLKRRSDLLLGGWCVRPEKGPGNREKPV